MKKSILLLVSGLLIFFSQKSIAQDIALNDTICSTAAALNYNVLSNDIITDPTSPIFVIVLFNNADQCIHLDELGNLTVTDPSCCGEYLLRYSLESLGQPANAVAEVHVKILCPKPDCSNINLTPYINPDNESCIAVCENSIATYHIDDLGLGNYPWNVVGGTVISGQGTTDFQVQWNGPGSGIINLSNPLGGANVNICVNILASPVAAISGDSYVCLGNLASFSGSSSIGANSYFWDFGDNSQATGQSVTHSYTNPGSYQVSLIVTAANTTAGGEPSCCCTDTTYWNLVVDSLPGPKIYWVSTLCEGDETKYWTDANCSNFNWSVSANGNITAGQGTDTICVTWATGPAGMVTLDVNPCAGFCTAPTTVTIPIIPSVANINGPTVVCVGRTEIYSVPKWPGTVYDWDVPSGGQIVSDDTSSTVTIYWPTTGTFPVNVSYWNPFLQCLPDHDNSDCTGSGTLNVSVKPDFGIQAPNPNIVCVGDPGSFNILPSGNYTWSITPSVSFSGQGSSSISLNWNTTPGYYSISAVPLDTTLYCNKKSSISIQVVEMAKPQTITGETSICIGDSYLYQVQSSQIGTTFNWQVNNGTPSSGTGTDLSVTWGASGPYWIAVSQTMGSTPFCTSDTIQLMINPKTLLPLGPINGPNGCVNSVQTYSVGPVQHPDAVYSWVISNPLTGSVISTQDSSSVNIQWNNISGQITLTVNVTLCGVTLSQNTTINILPAVQPVITSSGFLCSGGVTLCVNNVTVVSWSGGNTPNSACTTVSTAGQYSVTTIDGNGCTATGITQVSDDGVPIAQISAPAVRICTVNNDNGEVRSIFAIHSPNSTYAWFCNNGSGPVLAVPQPSNPEIFIHTETGVDGNYAYYAIVTENTTGCSKQSNTVVITESSPCGGPGPGCDFLQTHNLSFLASDNNPICNIIDVNTTQSPNVTLLSWNFGDPLNNVNNFSPSLDPAQHTYTNAGYYPITLTASVPRNTVPVTFCLIERDTIVCIPVGADFQWSSICSTVNLSQMASVLTGFSIASYQWDFGDTNTGSGPTTSHTYAVGGTYPVKLTVILTNGCTAEVIKNVTVVGDPLVGISIAPNPPYCVGDALNFSGSGSNIISWLWNFGDASQNGAQNASHSYATMGNYTVTLTGTNADGCVGSNTQNITISPKPVPGIITFNPSLTFCQGDSIILTAPSCSGCTYVWNNSSTSPTLTVTTAGDFWVKVTDANGCFYTTPTVTTNVLSLPDATISGNPIICNQGSTVLSVPAGAASYQWTDVSTAVVSTSNTLTVFANNIASPYSVNVTGTNGCTATGSVLVSNAVSPSFSISIAPDPCAGSPSTLNVTPVQPNVIYSWSNGATGPTQTTSIAGTYYATGTDTISGCTYTASGTIFPLPEICTFPTGCYSFCEPKTICGPSGMTLYQWYLNGTPHSNNQCVLLSSSGTYTLEVTSPQGCMNISEELIIELIPCDCENVDISAHLVVSPEGVVDSCCVLLDYTNNSPTPLKYLNLTSVNGDLNTSGLSSLFTPVGSGPNYIALKGSSSSGDLPSGSLSNILELCITNPTSVPQYLIVEWYENDTLIVCSDTLEFNCPIEPPCAYLESDSIYCVGTQVYYDVSICNPYANPWPVAYLDLLTVGGATLSPLVGTLSPPIFPGQCRSFTFQVTGNYVPGDSLCYSISSHDADPNLIDTALCCISDPYYKVIPDCDPCKDVSLIQDTIGCCVNWSIVNNFQAGYFDGIDICVLSPNSTLTIANTPGSGWSTISNNGVLISLDVKPIGGSIPLGTSLMPQLCMTTTDAPAQYVEIKWMRGDTIACRDTIIFECDPPCGYVQDTVMCSPSGGYTYSFDVTNTSGYTMDHGVLVVTRPSGASISQLYPFLSGGLQSGSTDGTFVLNLPPSIGVAGDSICFTMSLHETGADSLHINCCNFQHCFVLPDCPSDSLCACDEKFNSDVQAGFTVQSIGVRRIGVTPLNVGQFISDCDSVSWSWGDGSPDEISGLPSSGTHTYLSDGTYLVCMTIFRDTGFELCTSTVCMTIQIAGPILSCAVFETAPVDLTKSFQAVNGVQDRLQVKWYKDSPQIKYSDEDAAACDIQFWKRRAIDPQTGLGIGPLLQNPDTVMLIDKKKFNTDGSPRSIFKWPLFFRADGVNNSMRVEPNFKYQWRVRCACEHGAGVESPWSEVKFFNTPDFDPVTGVLVPPNIAPTENGGATLITNDIEIELFPNPNVGELINIIINGSIESVERSLVEIVDMMGKTIYLQTQLIQKEDLTFPIRFDPALKPGIYLLRLSIDRTNYYDKFLVR